MVNVRWASGRTAAVLGGAFLFAAMAGVPAGGFGQGALLRGTGSWESGEGWRSVGEGQVVCYSEGSLPFTTLTMWIVRRWSGATAVLLVLWGLLASYGWYTSWKQHQETLWEYRENLGPCYINTPQPH